MYVFVILEAKRQGTAAASEVLRVLCDLNFVNKSLNLQLNKGISTKGARIYHKYHYTTLTQNYLGTMEISNE